MARRTRSGSGTRTISWRWRKRPNRICMGGVSAPGSSAWKLEHDNLRAALAWAIANASAIGLRLAGALGWFWHFHGYHREGRDWLLQALDRATDGVGADIDRLRAKALNQAGYLAIWLRDVPQATALLEQSVALWRAAGRAARPRACPLRLWCSRVQSGQRRERACAAGREHRGLPPGGREAGPGPGAVLAWAYNLFPG